ncbi:MAG: NAD(P)H-dependent glycerol-3-phosphate dehydrogenase [Treponemataceae bacterium]|nr:MAG: NAD(P)H-dependent glycerol-3-phosphate dehydrogenase [Treponemataceae bacterium]
MLGAGAWGCAVANAISRGGHDVTVWTRNNEAADGINNHHTNTRYLSGYPLHPALKASTDAAAVAAEKDFILLASPSLYLKKTLSLILDVPGIKNGETCIGVLTKGFIEHDGTPALIIKTLESILGKVYEKNLVYISGPSHAEEVMTEKLTGLIAASENPLNSIKFRELLKVPGLMVYSSLDVIGVQVCAAAKNVIAVAFGCMDALAEKSALFGDNTASLLLAAGLNEIQTIGFALGATHPETFTSIAGVGDLDVTCRSQYGRNRKFGKSIVNDTVLEKFKSIDDIIARIGEIGYLAEGVVACNFVNRIRHEKNLKLPICSGLYRILNKEVSPHDYIKEITGDIL